MPSGGTYSPLLSTWVLQHGDTEQHYLLQADGLGLVLRENSSQVALGELVPIK